MLYNVAVTVNVDKCFAYNCEQDLPIGQIVTVSFGHRNIVAIIESNNTQYYGKTKTINSILPYNINPQYLQLAQYMADYTITNSGKIIKLIVPFNSAQILKPYKEPKTIQFSEKQIALNNEQLCALKKIRNNGVTLLHGVTGSGKTEVFLEFAKGKNQILIIVPEIALSDELAKKVSARTNMPVYLWHHSISAGQKLNIWKKAICGEQMAVVGARSALFIPFANLDCIIIDEEHDESLKQSENIIYNAKDIAIFLAGIKTIPIILSSATPSVETFYNAISGKYCYVKIASKFYQGQEKYNIQISDLRNNKSLLTNDSIQAIKHCLQIGKQALVFVNRRGHTPKTVCSICGWKITCPNCDAWLCYHSAWNKLICHYCGHERTIPECCPQCSCKHFVGLGIGVEKAKAEVSEIFQNAKITVISSDVMNTQNKISQTIKSLQNAEYDIIIGTQILAKGHNFPNLNTIIVTCVDSMLFGEDFRASEKTFQLLYQISGRAGRFSQSSGANIIYQTYSPDDNLIKMIAAGDLNKLYEIEIANRKALEMPPFGNICSITLSAINQDTLQKNAKILTKNIQISDNINVIGPITPNISKIKNRYRLRFIVTGQHPLQNFVKSWIQKSKLSKEITVTIDIDPYNFM